MLKIPNISVYIPVFNYARYIEKAIQSVLNQTFKDWELIVINDGSTDGTEEILRKYESHDKVTVVNQENKGLTKSCNIALRLANGEYVMRLDGDDYLDENALLVMTHFLDENPEIGLVYPDYYLIDEHDEVLSIERREKISSDEWVLLDIPPHGACTMFRKHILQELGEYDEEIVCQDGYDMWIRFIENYKADNINLPLFYYRQHSGSLTKNHERILDTRQKIKRKHAELKRKRLKASKIKRVAIIPARTHTNIMPKLALQECAGQPLINYTIDEAIKSASFNSIVVVSEDDEILHHTENNYKKDVLTVTRPLEYGRRNTGIEKTVQLVLDVLKKNKGEEYEEGMLIFIESPLKKSKHILKAIDTMYIFETDSVISLCETNSPYYIRNNNSLERIGNQEQFRLERNTIYRGNGALFLFKIKNLAKGAIFGEKIGHIIMLKEESININSPFDYKIAEFLIKERNISLPSNT
ncbi:MAG: hypothetical protein A2Y66_03270 [Nitrospirae bacterium RBG_13_41_22]|nr:MAG: hypothetical protein A2Y66_03270 [Nitrospirae bacterium RBG_13_41_22]